MSTRNRILLVILIQTLVLFTIIGMRQWTLTTGQQVLLETTPIDPRSLFAGDYVNLAYKIGSITVNRDFFNKATFNDTIYVVLAPKGNYWATEAAYANKPEVSSPNVIIKGTVDGKIQEKDTYRLAVRYGIENYFIPEGEGKKLEQPKPEEIVTVKVAVDRFGNAAIAGVLVNNKEIYQEKLF